MRAFLGLLASCALVAVAATLSGCGTETFNPSAPEATPSALPTFPVTLAKDGTVPWVDAPGAAPAPKPTPTPPAVGPTCTAAQLQGVLPAWVSGEQTNDGGMDPMAAGSLHGWVNLTNISSAPCTLDGAPTVTMMSHGTPVNVSYGRSDANAAKVGLPAHGTVNFPITWAAPYCPGERGPFPGPRDLGPFGLRAELDGVTLDIAVHGTVTPGCPPDRGDSISTIATFPVEPGEMTPDAPPPGASSPLRLLRATASGYPRQIAPGQVLKFVIALANPASKPVSLAGTPPPAYAIGASCLGTPAKSGFSFGRIYSLNNRARPVVGPHDSVKFAMELAVPASGCGTTQLVIAWRFPVYIPQGTDAGFTIKLTS